MQHHDEARERESVLRPGETCWRVERAARVAFLIDGEAYFAAVAEALERARHDVWLIGWDFHTSVRLRRPDPGADGRAAQGSSDAGAGAAEREARTEDLVGLLEATVRRRPSLDVRVLAWDYAMLYALERELLPLVQFGAKTHRRIHFRMDDTHALGASQHQKIVVVDDAVAFVGGFDLTAHRWDTRAHAPDEPRRVTPAGETYQPFHDVQIAVDGDAAAALGELARSRWSRATGERVPPVSPTAAAASDPWPARLEPDARDVRIGIARTRIPTQAGRPEIREVEALYGASLAAARRWIYVENQYLTAARIGEWLLARLGEPEGPEIVIVGPRRNDGWLERGSMGALRERLIARLRQADRHDRLRLLHPHVEGLGEDRILNVHAKVMVIDDDFVRVGSSNLSNRSLGLDTECDLAFESAGRADLRRAIAAFRNDLIAEHLGRRPGIVAEVLRETGSLVATIDALSGGPRDLRPIEPEVGAWAAGAVDVLRAADPEHPAPLEQLLVRFDEDRLPAPRRSRRRLMLELALVVAAAGGAALLFRFTPIGDWLASADWLRASAFLRESRFGPLVALLGFVLAAVAFVPVMALTAAAGLALGPAIGLPVALIGSTLAAAVGHRVGAHLWRDSVRRVAGARLDDLSRRLARRGVLSSTLVRIVPIAPFMVVNLVAGASHVRLRDFLIGTLIGMLPGALVLVVAADWTRLVFTDAKDASRVWIALALLALVGLVAALRRLPRPDRARPMDDAR